MCGECTRPLGTHNECYPSGLESVQVTGGYDSYHLFDMTSYKFSICEKCLRGLFDNFKIPPVVSDMYQGSTYAEDKEMYDYRIWKDTGGHHEAYVNGKCNFIKDCQNKAVYTQYISDEFTESCCCEEHKGRWGYGNSRLGPFVSHTLRVFL